MKWFNDFDFLVFNFVVTFNLIDNEKSVSLSHFQQVLFRVVAFKQYFHFHCFLCPSAQ